MSEDDTKPYKEALFDYRLHLRSDIERDYKSLDLCYDLMNQIDQEYKKGKVGLTQHIDMFLKVSYQINAIHDRIRKRLYL